MTSVHEDMAHAILDDFMSDADGARALQVYVAGIRDGRWPDEYREAIHQQHSRAPRWPMEQIAAFAHMHSELMSGDVAQVQLTTFGATPDADAERLANAAALQGLPRPFIAEVDLAQNSADQDGQLQLPAFLEARLSRPLHCAFKREFQQVSAPGKRRR